MSAISNTNPQEILYSDPPRSQLLTLFLKTMANKQGKTGIILLSLVIIAGAGANWIAPYAAREQQEGARLLGPSFTHLLGTDEIGRDIFIHLY